MDQRTRKPLIIKKALHPRDDVDKLYVSLKEGGRGFAVLKTMLRHRFEDYIDKHNLGMITFIRQLRKWKEIENRKWYKIQTKKNRMLL